MIFILALAFIAVNSVYWIFIFSALSFYRQGGRKGHANEELSERSAIIIPIRDKGDISGEGIGSFAGQSPGNHELIIVDDHAGIENIFQDLIEKSVSNNADKPGFLANKRELSLLKVIKNEYSQGKKFALSYGIEQTDREFIILTDADCYAASESWLVHMTSPFKDVKTDIVLGYSPYRGKGMLALFVRFETFMAALQYFSYALRGMPYMGVGRNMAFRKSLFINNRGFDNHIDLLSGSDDLFVSEAAKAGNVGIQTNPDSFVYTYPPESLKGFIRQKTRHISTSFRYKWKTKILLGLYAFSHIGAYVALFILLAFGEIQTGVLLMILRFIVIMISSYGSFIKLGEKKLLYWFPILDFLMFIYYLVLPLFYLIYDKKRWK
jgi:cellulose synthase/poly-beta-1,6-N-acetylglucosamine synthase-like glycosyltransferase